jgi:DnaJ-class molecular chaperone
MNDPLIPGPTDNSAFNLVHASVRSTEQEPQKRVCPYCHGRGENASDNIEGRYLIVTCDKCRGTGFIDA